jgi:hypothetical protein
MIMQKHKTLRSEPDEQMASSCAVAPQLPRLSSSEGQQQLADHVLPLLHVQSNDAALAVKSQYKLLSMCIVRRPM